MLTLDQRRDYLILVILKHLFSDNQDQVALIMKQPSILRYVSLSCRCLNTVQVFFIVETCLFNILPFKISVTTFHQLLTNFEGN